MAAIEGWQALQLHEQLSLTVKLFSSLFIHQEIAWDDLHSYLNTLRGQLKLSAVHGSEVSFSDHLVPSLGVLLETILHVDVEIADPLEVHLSYCFLIMADSD